MADCPHGMPTPAACFECMEDGNLEPPPRPDPERYHPHSQVEARHTDDCGLCDWPIRPLDQIVITTRSRWVHNQCAVNQLEPEP